MRVLVLSAVLLCLMVTVAAADEYSCRSLGGEDKVTFDFTTRYASGAHAVLGASFQIEGDIGYSTTATEPTSLATVTGVEGDGERIRFSMHYTDAQYDGDIATIHVVTLTEGAHALTAGVLHVVGGGLWPIECEIRYEG